MTTLFELYLASGMKESDDGTAIVVELGAPPKPFEVEFAVTLTGVEYRHNQEAVVELTEWLSGRSFLVPLSAVRLAETPAAVASEPSRGKRERFLRRSFAAHLGYWSAHVRGYFGQITTPHEVGVAERAFRAGWDSRGRWERRQR